MRRLKRLSEVVDMVSHCELVQDNSLRVSCWLALGEWRVTENNSPSTFIPEPLQLDVLTAFKRATAFEHCGYKAWHAWSLFNFRLAEQHAESDEGLTTSGDRNKRNPSSSLLRNHVVAAAKGFVTSISLGAKKWSASVSEDLLNLLSCLFKYGELTEVARTINEGIGKVAVEAWLGVLPQLLARIHIRNPSVRSVLHPLLTRLGEKHPQALMYPLSVLLKSPVVERKSAAESLMNSLRAHSSALVQEALMVSSELIRVAILWLETWHEGLEDASRLYFGEGNASGMLELLLPLHENLEKGAETGCEGLFIKSFGQDLDQAHVFIKDYMRLISATAPNALFGTAEAIDAARLARHSEEAETVMNKIWDIYYTVFRRINKQLPGLTTLELGQCSPALS
jgi:FKBP12-rapamycin complex-associated protein